MTFFAEMHRPSMLRYAVSQAPAGHAALDQVIMCLTSPKEDRNGGNPELVSKLHQALSGTRDALTAVTGSILH